MEKSTAEKKVKVTISDTQAFEVSTHETLLRSLTEAGIMLEATCGGQGSCGKCRIRVLSGKVVDGQELCAEFGYVLNQVLPNHF